ncbi:MAG: ATP cone domain-containing protein [Ignavibacteriaceae bacterium]|nr:ATP cone domain-containing protein [Ignavibacteriaceae bacterium]MCW8812821.1 ATP cone domain-containing protein [Chlorobium sp.]MCW8994919.1 ATP cone domain-containing protein [Psychromonas sp.]MCW8818432.1 ATP cone domain-containing protein [Ignavibacteriaceae bacterium]MCW8823244.1 ATP cone domain-containing protein [Ignavibacteriaceae bacterium]
MKNKITHVKKRSGAIVPFKQERIANAIYRAVVAVGGRDKEKAGELAEQVVQILNEKFDEKKYPYIEDVQDVVEKVLIENGHAKVAKEYILYREEAAKRRDEEGRINSKLNENIPWAKVWRNLDWAVEHKLNTVDLLNKRVANGEFAQIVHESERLYEDDVELAARLIIEKLKDLRMVMISGPSSSGKTSTTVKLEQKLIKKGYKFKALNVDHYFFDLEIHPKDEFGDYDFETPQALDLQLINEHLSKLSNGEEVLIPSYEFKTGTRTLNVTPMKLEKDEILLIDSLHGLYPDFSKDIPIDVKFKLYLEPLLQMKDPDEKYIRWTDIRLIRRMLRDYAHRAYNPTQTLEHWHYVRSSEMRNIIPYSNTADYIISSAMPYELSLYAQKLTNSFAEWEKKYMDDPLKTDAYERASRLYNLLKCLTPVADDSPVPHDSVLREFIGGSSIVH